MAVCENPEADHAVFEEGADAAGPLGGFGGPTLEEPWAATVWMPVLGEGKLEQLNALLEAIGPDEVIPVLPFPARDPRRSDDLLLEYRELLIDRLGIDPRNLPYAAEWNPFDALSSCNRAAQQVPVRVATPRSSKACPLEPLL